MWPPPIRGSGEGAALLALAHGFLFLALETGVDLEPWSGMRNENKANSERPRGDLWSDPCLGGEIALDDGGKSSTRGTQDK